MAGYTYDPAAAQARYNQRAAAGPGDLNQPYQPLGSSPIGAGPTSAGPGPADSIANYRPKRHVGWYIVAGVIVVVAISVGLLLNNLAAPATPAPTTSGSQPTMTDTRTGGLPFSDGGRTTGYWRITHCVWTDDSVTITVEIDVDSGTLHYEFYAYDNQAGATLQPDYVTPDALVPGFLGPGQSITGSLTFSVSQRAMTLVLASDDLYTQLSALTVPT